MGEDARLLRWERRTELPLVGAAVVFLGAYAWPILDPGLAGGARAACRIAGAAVWLLFGLDYAVRLAWARRRWRFVRENWLDAVLLAVPMLRPLRALRVVLALNVLARAGTNVARGRVVAAVSAAVAVVAFVASLAMLDAERANPEANIRSFGDALWWAATTVPTVGYGDRYPTTTTGRWIAVGLFLTGIALVGVVTAAFASWFVDRMSEVSEAEARTGAEVAELAEEVRALRAEIAALRADGRGPPGPGGV